MHTGRGGHSQVLLDQCQRADFAMLVELAMSADVNCRDNDSMILDGIGSKVMIYNGSKIERAPKRARCSMKKGSAWLCSDH